MKQEFMFGYGLSYTTFDYTDMAMETKKGKIDVSFTLKNSGSQDEENVVQLYTSSLLEGERPYFVLKFLSKSVT